MAIGTCGGVSRRLLFDALHDEQLDPRALLRGEVAAESFLEFFQNEVARHDLFAVLCKDVVDGGYVRGAFSRRNADAKGEFLRMCAQLGVLLMVSVCVCCRAD